MKSSLITTDPSHENISNKFNASNSSAPDHSLGFTNEKLFPVANIVSNLFIIVESIGDISSIDGTDESISQPKTGDASYTFVPSTI